MQSVPQITKGKTPSPYVETCADLLRFADSTEDTRMAKRVKVRRGRREMHKVRHHKGIGRMVRRKRLQNLLAYHEQLGHTALVRKYTALLAQIPIGGVLPDIEQSCIGHCGVWHVVTATPMTAPCCGVVLLELREDTGRL